MSSLWGSSLPEAVQEQAVELRDSPSALHRSIENADVVACRYLLEMRADPRAVDDTNRETPLEAAITTSNVEIAKLLVDHGVVPSTEEQLYIQAQLTESKTPPYAINAFMIPCPDLYAPQIFYKTGFVSLFSFPGMSVAQAGFKAPLVVYCVGQDAVGPYYGAVLRTFAASKNALYAKIAEKLTVVRVVVDDKNRIVPMIDRIKELLPDLPLLHLALDGHGNSDGLTLSKSGEGRITKDETILCRELTRRVHILGTLGILGCDCGAGLDNFVKWLSLQADGRLVCGSSGSVYDEFLALIESDTPEFPVPLHFFKLSLSDPSKSEVAVVYFCGLKVWEGSLIDPAQLQELSDFCRSWSESQGERLIQFR